MNEWILIIFISTNSFWHFPNGEEFKTKKDCVSYLKSHRIMAKYFNETVFGQCVSAYE